MITKPIKKRTLTLDGQRIEYTTRVSSSSKQCRVRVGPSGVEVIVPGGESEKRASDFLKKNAEWVLNQVDRVNGLKPIKISSQQRQNVILLRGDNVSIFVDKTPSRKGSNLVEQQEGCLVIRRGLKSTTSPMHTLENWLRREARSDISDSLFRNQPSIRRRYSRVYIMGQRTKWGNCSALGNLSFNWRLIMSPPFVLDYVVVHELVHLVFPDHSTKFRLKIRSHCRDAARAKDWLRRHQSLLVQPLKYGVLPSPRFASKGSNKS